MTAEFHFRIARMSDVEILTSLMTASISTLQNDFLNPAQVAASFEVMGLDTRLINDQTYFTLLYGQTIVGCGGWSKRTTLFGGNHTDGRDDALLNPKKDAARIRAMYTHPNWKRRGIGRMILKLCEDAARKDGFQRCELAATLSGQPLYSAAGYQRVKNFSATTPQNINIPLIKMMKTL